jgi:hypothetical protein
LVARGKIWNSPNQISYLGTHRCPYCSINFGLLSTFIRL